MDGSVTDVLGGGSSGVLELTGRDGELLCRVRPGSGPVVAFALHAGHSLRPDLANYVTLPEDDRLREEDPFTAVMAPEGVLLVEPVRSRFEVDLNRPRERAVYGGPEDAWGLEIYSNPLPNEMVNHSLDVYDDFYEFAHRILCEVERQYGRFVVLDLHSYNHRRDGVGAAPAAAELNPEVNVGTGRIDRSAWSPVVDRFIASMSESGFDCRENVKFRGGHFSQWVSECFPAQGVALAIEFKKTYMDEWTGLSDSAAVDRIRGALNTATEGIEQALAQMA